MSVVSDFRSNARRLGAPVTVSLVLITIAVFLAEFFGQQSFPVRSLAFNSVDGLSSPWTMLTYPFVGNDILAVLFGCLWLWGIGSSVERELGSVRYAIAWAVFSMLSALFLFGGARIVNQHAFLTEIWVALGAVTVMWGTRNPTAPITLMFVLPITGRWMAWLAGVFAFFSTHPKLAPFAALPLILAYFFAANKLPIPYTGGGQLRSGKKGAATVRGAGMYSKEYFDEVQRREKEREEKERLRKLFERSLIEDPDKKDAEG